MFMRQTEIQSRCHAVSFPLRYSLAVTILIVTMTAANPQPADSEVSIMVRNGRIQNQTTRVNMRVDTDLILVPVTVTDSLNRPVADLDKTNFHVFEGGIEQRVSYLSCEDSPIAVGVLFDASASMRSKMVKSREAVAQFLTTVNAEDDFFLVEFSDRPRLAHALPSSAQEIQNALTFIAPQGRTALLDAISLGLHELRKSKKPRKALLILSDGGDNASRYSALEVRHMIRESDALIYAIGIFESSSISAPSSAELSGPSLLSAITHQAGGQMFPVSDIRDLADVASRIGTELRNH